MTALVFAILYTFCADYITVNDETVDVSIARGVALFDPAIERVYTDVFAKSGHLMYMNKDEMKVYVHKQKYSRLGRVHGAPTAEPVNFAVSGPQNLAMGFEAANRCYFSCSGIYEMIVSCDYMFQKYGVKVTVQHNNFARPVVACKLIRIKSTASYEAVFVFI